MKPLVGLFPLRSHANTCSMRYTVTANDIRQQGRPQTRTEHPHPHPKLTRIVPKAGGLDNCVLARARFLMLVVPAWLMVACLSGAHVPLHVLVATRLNTAWQADNTLDWSSRLQELPNCVHNLS